MPSKHVIARARRTFMGPPQVKHLTALRSRLAWPTWSPPQLGNFQTPCDITGLKSLHHRGTMIIGLREDQHHGPASGVGGPRAAGVERLLTEQTSAVGPRKAIDDAIDFAREGDAPVVSGLKWKTPLAAAAGSHCSRSA